MTEKLGFGLSPELIGGVGMIQNLGIKSGELPCGGQLKFRRNRGSGHL